MSERISRITNHPSFVPVTVSLVSMGIGMGVGFILGRKTSKKIHVIPAQEPFDYEEMEAFIAGEEAKLKDRNDDEEIVVPNADSISDSDRSEVGARMVAETLKREMTSTHNTEPEIVTNTEFAESNEDWNYEREQANRNSNRPYVIHYDEFFAKEMEDSGYLQTTLTYYAGDNILTDKEEQPIYDMSIIGELKFGHGSRGDPNVFYVRNDKRKGEYEVVRDNGHYLEEVMGLERDGERPKRLSHSKVDKFRPDD